MRIQSLSKVLLALCFVLFSSVALMGCGGNEPDVDVKALAEAVGHGDAAAAKEFKLAEKDSTGIDAKFIQEMGKAIGANKESMDAAQKAITEKFKSLKYKTEVVSKTENSAKVKVTTDYINLMDAFAGMMQGMEKEAEKLNPDDPNVFDKLGEISMNLLAKEITNAKVEGQQSFEVEVTKNKDTGKWMPADLNKFQEELARYMLFKGGDDSIMNEIK